MAGVGFEASRGVSPNRQMKYGKQKRFQTPAIDIEAENVIARIAAGDIKRHLLFGDAAQMEIGVENPLFAIDGLDQVVAIGRDDGAPAIQQHGIGLSAVGALPA